MKFILGIAASFLLSTLVLAQAGKPDAKAKEDIAIHRTIAAAHEKAAKCLESGKPEKECHAHFPVECKAIAIGKHCGMRHRH